MTEYSELEKELRKASDEGDADASYRLAVLMRDGAEGIPRRPFESSMFFRKASDMNHVNATVLLGLMYLEGLGDHGRSQKGRGSLLQGREPR